MSTSYFNEDTKLMKEREASRKEEDYYNDIESWKRNSPEYQRYAVECNKIYKAWKSTIPKDTQNGC